jgi:hypothetical protein
MVLMDDQVGDFMHIGNQEKEWVTIVVDGDPGYAPFVTSKVADFGDAALTKFEFKRVSLPKLEAVHQRGGWNMLIQYGIECGGIHRHKKKALV